MATTSHEIRAIATLKDLDESDDKTEALLVKKSVEDKGEYLGTKLDADRCDSLRKMLGAGELLDGKD